MNYSINTFIYENVIDRILSGAQKFILEELGAGDRVLDVACGTGSLSISAGGVASQVLGIDLSEEMINIARDKAKRMGLENAIFELRDASDLSSFNDNSFDKAVTSMAVHQFDPDLAIRILKEMKRIAGQVLIMDYNHPLSSGSSRSVIYLIEWIAGGDHYRNFLNYNKMGGLDYFLSESGLKIKSELFSSSAFRVVSCI